MTIREKLSRVRPVEDPSWVESAPATTKELYYSAKKEFEKIKHMISSGAEIPLRHRKINQTSVATNVNRDKSILSKRRQPKVMQWIEDANAELVILLSRPEKKVSKKKSAASLLAELTLIKNESNADVTDLLRSFVEKVFTSNLLDDRDLLARENLRLKSQIEALDTKINKLKDLCNQQAEQISRLKHPKAKIALTVLHGGESD